MLGWCLVGLPLNWTQICRLAVLCVCCDIPASRKRCGFLGFSAKKGCNKCLKEFPRSSFGEKQDFSGFDWNRWNVRTNTDHKEQVWRIRNTGTSKKHVMIIKVFMVCDWAESLYGWNQSRFNMHPNVFGASKKALLQHSWNFSRLIHHKYPQEGWDLEDTSYAARTCQQNQVAWGVLLGFSSLSGNRTLSLLLKLVPRVWNG